MLQYVVKRILLMIPTMLAISVIVFTIIQLPPGNYLESYIAELQAQGESVDPQKIAFLREYYGLDKPLVEQYLRWASGMLRGDFGYSFEFNMPVTKVVGDRMFLTIIVSFVTIIFTWAVAFPIGIYSATHQYSWGDYGLSLGIVTRDVMRGLALAEQIPTGIVHINDQTVNDEANVPFGGVGASGLGRLGGAAANIEAFTETRWITMRGEPASYPF